MSAATSTLQDLPDHLQSQVLALGSAPLTTCRAAAAILHDPWLVAIWLRARHKLPVQQAAAAGLWPALCRLLDMGHSPEQCEVAAALVQAAGAGQGGPLHRLLSLFSTSFPTSKTTLSSCSLATTSHSRSSSRSASRATLGNEALRAAATHGHPQVVTLLLDSGRLHITPAGVREALHGAVSARDSSTEVMEVLLDRRPDAGCLPTGTCSSAAQASLLTLAAQHGNLAATRLLLHHGADPLNRPGTPYSGVSSGMYTSSLDAAAGAGHAEIVGLMLDHLGPAWRGGYGASLEAAACGGHLQVLQLLLDHGADAQARHGRWALRIAARHGHEAAVALLLDAGVDINAVEGAALRAAVRHSRASVVELLLQRGADIGLGGGAGAGPEVLRYCRDPGIARMLLARCSCGSSSTSSSGVCDLDEESQDQLVALGVTHGDTQLLRLLAERGISMPAQTLQALEPGTAAA